MVFSWSLILLAVTGGLIRLVDSIVDEGFQVKKLGRLDSLMGFAYGLLGGFAASSSPELATVAIAVAVGVLLSGKIDRRAHQYGIAGLVLALAALGFPQVNLFVLFLLLLTSVVDEKINDFIQGRKGLLEEILQARLLLELVALVVSFYLNDWVYFLAVFSFDVGYHVAGTLTKAPSKRLTGTHLILDLFDCKRDKLKDAKFIKRLLTELPEELGMRRIGEPQVHELPPSKGLDAGGVSGFVVIAESHISIHTFTATREASVDVFSCKPFNAKKLEKLVKRGFGAKKSESKIIQRWRRKEVSL